ncbi:MULTISPECIES: Dabb family protein [Marinomonas]|uniref:Dabb family protein n=1 Tax=Marinomonas TaxID=28253 RepID=UPI0010549461|nr:Dabb family protein [Marinomonas flavescens]
MIRHVLFIQFKAEVTADAITQCLGNLVALKNKIDGIESVEWGENNSPEGRAKGYTHCVFMTFCDGESRDKYIPHPAHEELKAELGPILEDIIVFDYAL